MEKWIYRAAHKTPLDATPLPKPKTPFTCPQDKSGCDCITTCPEELRVDCPDKLDPNRCCQGCMASEAEDEGSQ